MEDSVDTYVVGMDFNEETLSKHILLREFDDHVSDTVFLPLLHILQQQRSASIYAIPILVEDVAGPSHWLTGTAPKIQESPEMQDSPCTRPVFIKAADKRM